MHRKIRIRWIFHRAAKIPSFCKTHSTIKIHALLQHMLNLIATFDVFNVSKATFKKTTKNCINAKLIGVCIKQPCCSLTLDFIPEGFSSLNNRRFRCFYSSIGSDDSHRFYALNMNPCDILIFYLLYKK
jgi:hypothetical protein